jgi:uncharacterized protein with GYD domain
VERYVTLIGVTPKDREPYERSDYSTQIRQIVEHFGGQTEGIWAFGGGPYQFVSVAIYPDKTSALKARTQIEALGIVTTEGYPVFEMSECLQAMAA